MNFIGKPFLSVAGLLFLFLSTTPANAQQEIKYIKSGEVIEKGIKEHDKEEYKKAIALYQQVAEGDTNYAIALNEQIISYLADSAFDDARRVAIQALATENNSFRRQLLLYLGHAYDYMGKTDSALRCYDSLISINQYDHQPYYEKGVVYYQKKDYAKACEQFQRSLMLNPYHFRSHYFLSYVYAFQGRFTEALMASGASLFFTNDSKSADGPLYILNRVTNQTDEMAKAFRENKTANADDDFSEIDEIIQSKLALSKQYKFESDLAGEKIINTLHVMMEKLSYNTSNDKFAMQYYAPLYTQVFKDEQFGPLVLFMFSGYNIEVVDKLAKKNKGDLKDIQKFVFSYFDKIAATNTLNYTQRKKAPEKFAAVPSENLFIVGTFKSTKPLVFNPGAVTIYTDGVLSSTGRYDATGLKEGEFKYYYASGALRAVQSYKNDKLVGPSTGYYKNGNVKDEYVFDSEGKQKTEKNYRSNGTLKNVTTTTGDKTKLALYFSNGVKELEGYIKDNNLEDGAYTYYFNDGTKSRELTIARGKLDGASRDYYRNGKMYEEGNFKGGDRDGLFTKYYKNGKIASKEFYTKGKRDGTFEDYNMDGVLLEKNIYRNGRKNSIDSSFTNHGKFYGMVKYKGDAPVAYYYIDETGKVLGEGKDEDGLRKLMVYYSNGNLRSDIPYRDGKANGLSKYYSESGSLSKAINYKNDEPEGMSTEYHKNGVVKSEINKTAGMEDGYYKSNYASGILYCEGWIKENKKQRTWKYYDVAGKLSMQCFYLNDEPNGPSVSYFPTGRPNYTDYFDNGMLVGITQYDSAGRIMHQNRFPNGTGTYKVVFPNGRTVFECAVKHGEYNGSYKRMLPNGQITETGHYTNGLRDSVYERHYITGILAAKGSYKNNERVGRFMFYDEEGELWQDENYVEGKLDGPRKVWENGHLRYESNYRNGDRHGVQTIYGENNKIACVMNYENGELVSYTYQGKDGKLLPATPVKNGTCKINATYANEAPSVTIALKENMYDGNYQIFYSTGQKAEERIYEKTNLNGSYKKWALSGKLLYEANYKNDEMIGKESEYDSRGNLIYSIEHAEGGHNHGTSVFMNPKTKKQLTVRFYYGNVVDAK